MNKKKQKIVIIGGNAAGPAAAAKAKRTDPLADVTLYEAGSFISTGTCELPYLISGKIKDYNDIVFYNEHTFKEEKGVDVFVNHFAEEINRKEKVIKVVDRKENTTQFVNYDKLILTTGSSAKKVMGLTGNYKNAFTLKNVSDYLSIRKYLNETKVNSVVVIGAGYIGLEAAEVFTEIKKQVTVIEKAKLPLPNADPEIGSLLLNILSREQMDFIAGYEKIKFINDGTKISSVNIDGRIINADLIISAVGFTPNNTLAVGAELKTGKYNGLLVDGKLKTSDHNIFAAGDNIEVINKITGKGDYIPLAALAQKFAHIAGENAAGGNVFTGPVVKNIAVSLFGNVIVSVGLNEKEAAAHFYNYGSVFAVTPNLVKVMPGSENVFGKIIFNKSDGKILGASFIGNNEVIGYGDIIATYITNNLNGAKLKDVYYSYTPPVSPFINLLSVLGRKIEKEIK